MGTMTPPGDTPRVPLRKASASGRSPARGPPSEPRRMRVAVVVVAVSLVAVSGCGPQSLEGQPCTGADDPDVVCEERLQLRCNSQIYVRQSDCSSECTEGAPEVPHQGDISASQTWASLAASAGHGEVFCHCWAGPILFIMLLVRLKLPVSAFPHRLLQLVWSTSRAQAHV